MTPQARAITAFVLATMALVGWLNRVAFAVYVMFGGDLPGGDSERFVLSLLALLVAAGVLGFAHATAESGATGWETNLAQAARVLALIAVVITVMGLISVFTTDQTGFFGSFYVGG